MYIASGKKKSSERLTLLAEPSTRNDKSVVERNQRALTRDSVAQGGRVGLAYQLRPVAVDDLDPGGNEGIGDILEEGRVRVEVGDGLGFEFQSLSQEIVVDKVGNITLSEVGRVLADEGVEVGEDGLGRFVGGFVDEGLGVGVDLGDVHGLE